MNRTFATLSTLTLIAALTGPAAAQEVRVRLAGKDARTISAEIDKAAWTVCSQAYRGGDIGFFEVNSCARDAADTAKAKASEILATARASEMSALARNDSSLPSQ
jgi:hypothetical protein